MYVYEACAIYVYMSHVTYMRCICVHESCMYVVTYTYSVCTHISLQTLMWCACLHVWRLTADWLSLQSLHIRVWSHITSESADWCACRLSVCISQPAVSLQTCRHAHQTHISCACHISDTHIRHTCVMYVSHQAAHQTHIWCACYIRTHICTSDVCLMCCLRVTSGHTSNVRSDTHLMCVSDVSCACHISPKTMYVLIYIHARDICTYIHACMYMSRVTYMSHVTCMSHVYTIHVTYMCTWNIYVYMRARHVTYMYIWGMSHICMSHVTYMCIWFMSHICVHEKDIFVHVSSTVRVQSHVPARLCGYMRAYMTHSHMTHTRVMYINGRHRLPTRRTVGIFNSFSNDSYIQSCHM